MVAASGSAPGLDVLPAWVRSALLSPEPPPRPPWASVPPPLPAPPAVPPAASRPGSRSHLDRSRAPAAKATATATATRASRLGAGVFKESPPRVTCARSLITTGAPDTARNAKVPVPECDLDAGRSGQQQHRAWNRAGTTHRPGKGRSQPAALHRLSGARRPPQVPGTGPPPDPGDFHCRPRAGVRRPVGLLAVPGGRAVGALGRGEGLSREVARRVNKPRPPDPGTPPGTPPPPPEYDFGAPESRQILV